MNKYPLTSFGRIKAIRTKASANVDAKSKRREQLESYTENPLTKKESTRKPRSSKTRLEFSPMKASKAPKYSR